MIDKDRILAIYDEVAAQYGDEGVKVGEAIPEVQDRVRELVEQDRVELPSREVLLDEVVASTCRNGIRARRRALPSILATVKDALDDATILGRDDPILDIAESMGNGDGLTKLLRYWAPDDLLALTAASAENVRDVIEADKNLRQIVDPIISAMFRRSASTLDGLLS